VTHASACKAPQVNIVERLVINKPCAYVHENQEFSLQRYSYPLLTGEQP